MGHQDVNLIIEVLIYISLIATQTITATITGVVADQSGAVVPNVIVTATNVGTGVDHTVQSNSAGIYNLPLLPAGKYSISAEAPGFQKLVINPVELEVNQIARVDLRLALGTMTQEIRAEERAPLLQTESATIATAVSPTTITALPLNGRNFQQLTLLVPGTIGPDPRYFNSVGAQGRPYVNGNREQGNSFLLDGVSVDETIDNRIGYLPNIDAIAEFKVQTSNSAAEFGNVAGAIVNTTMKSGTNDFHAGVFEFFRNDALDANTWANNRNSTPEFRIGKPKLRQNVWGGTAGGPIVRNKIFFFGAFQDALQRTGGPTATSVVPEEWRHGDLSSVPIPIRDPRTGQAFPGNRIPEDRFSPTAKALFADSKLYPLPTRAGAADFIGNYATTTVGGITNYQIDGKIDARFSGKDTFSGRYSLGHNNDRNIRAPLPTDVTTRRFGNPQNAVLNWNRTTGPAAFNEARIGLNRAVFISEPFDWAGIGNANAKLGIPGNQAMAGLSLIAFGLGVGGRGQAENNVTNTFSFDDTFSVAAGRHLAKMGAQWLRYQENRFYPGNNGLLGFFDYDGTFTGYAFADFLLDQLHRKGVGSRSGTWGHRQNRIGVFVQDDFKVKPGVTLNLGVRWEYTSPLVEVKDRQSNFDIRSGRQLFAGRDGNSRALYAAYYRGFEPVVGFAWVPQALKAGLVVRGGYRITQFMEGTGANLRLPLNPPFFSEADAAFDASTGPGTISNGFADVIARNQIAGSIRIWNPDLRPQFTQQWNLTVERRLNGTMSVTAGYVGHEATHLVVPRDWNQPLPGTGDPAMWLPSNQRRPLYPFLPLVTQVTGTDSSGTSNFHALQVTARKRAAEGLEFLGSYTLSKAITDSLGFFGPAGVASPWNFWINAYHRRGDRGLASFDVRHNFVWSGTYDLPFGRGKRGAVILNGWSVSSIVSLHTGFPVTVTQSGGPLSSSLQDSAGGERPDRVPGRTGKLENHSPSLWLNINAYAPHRLGVFGNAGNSTERAPGFANWDFAVGRKFGVSENRYFDFRAEFFNFTNHPSFGPPANNISDPNTFGKVFDAVSPPRIIEFALKAYF